jgi:hypothetical protein
MNFFFLHPRTAVLQSFVDGELSSPRRLRVIRHFRNCPVCRLEAQQLEAAFTQFVALDREGLSEQRTGLNEGLARLESRMCFLHFSAPPESLSLHSLSLARRELHDRVFSELEVYLGSHAAMALVEKLGSSETAGSRGALEAECLLAAFLGRHVAARIIKSIIMVSQATPVASPRPPFAQDLV